MGRGQIDEREGKNDEWECGVGMGRAGAGGRCVRERLRQGEGREEESQGGEKMEQNFDETASRFL
jgi:hypothetical protein